MISEVVDRKHWSMLQWSYGDRELDILTPQGMLDAKRPEGPSPEYFFSKYLRVAQSGQSPRLGSGLSQVQILALRPVRGVIMMQRMEHNESPYDPPQMAMDNRSDSGRVRHNHFSIGVFHSMAIGITTGTTGITSPNKGLV